MFQKCSGHVRTFLSVSKPGGDPLARTHEGRGPARARLRPAPPGPCAARLPERPPLPRRPADPAPPRETTAEVGRRSGGPMAGTGARCRHPMDAPPILTDQRRMPDCRSCHSPVPSRPDQPPPPAPSRSSCRSFAAPRAVSARTPRMPMTCAGNAPEGLGPRRRGGPGGERRRPGHRPARLCLRHAAQRRQTPPAPARR
jgi:hypothetical protein